jgi:hypothetical protein
VIGVVVLDVAGEEITSISSVVNLDKLAHLGPVGDLPDEHSPCPNIDPCRSDCVPLSAERGL